MKIITLALILFFTINLNAQKFFTKEGKISFFSETPIENIDAVNNSVTSVFDTETGRMEFAVLIKAFHFEKALMEEHFNENYLESSTYPKAVFKGSVANFDEIDMSKDGSYEVTVKGDLTMHGVTKEIEADGKLEKKGNSIFANSSFMVALADYNIEIPGVVKDNIAEEIKIDVEIPYQPLQK